MRAFALSLLALAVFATSIVSAAGVTCNGPDARTVPPTGAIVVDATGKFHGSFRTISKAVANIPDTTDVHTVFIFPGVYREQVLISKLKGPLVLQGYTCNTMSYAANRVTITQAKAQKDIPAEIISGRNDLTSTLRLNTDKVKVYNLNVANTAGKVGQAVAAIIEGSDYGFYACKLTSYQDTLCTNTGRELFAKSYISGAVDYVFGMRAQAWFESCDFETIGNGSITANGRTDAANPSYYVFNKARVFGKSGKGTAYLGRPWRTFARVVWQNSYLSDIVNPEGWQRWNNDNNTAKVYFKEFGNKGAGAAVNKRVKFSGQLKAGVPITDILGKSYKSEWFVDSKFL